MTMRQPFKGYNKELKLLLKVAGVTESVVRIVKSNIKRPCRLSFKRKEVIFLTVSGLTLEDVSAGSRTEPEKHRAMNSTRTRLTLSDISRLVSAQMEWTRFMPTFTRAELIVSFGTLKCYLWCWGHLWGFWRDRVFLEVAFSLFSITAFCQLYTFMGTQ